jgi:hypothetical protein
MVLTAEQHLEIAARYEEAAADMTLPPDKRIEFARKANWFRILARMGAKSKRSESSPTSAEPLDT